MVYQIFYDYTVDNEYQYDNIIEFFGGSYTELQEHIEKMKTNGCYNITAVASEEVDKRELEEWC